MSGLLRALLIAFAGSAVVSILDDPSVRGWRATGIFVFACAFWICAGVDICILQPLEKARRYVESLYGKPVIELLDDRPGDTTRMMLQVDAAQYVFGDFTEQEIAALADGLLRGRPFSEREWKGKIRNFRAVQDEFEARGLVRIRGKKRELNGHGRLAMLKVKYGHGVRLPSPSELRSGVRAE